MNNNELLFQFNISKNNLKKLIGRENQPILRKLVVEMILDLVDHAMLLRSEKQNWELPAQFAMALYFTLKEATDVPPDLKTAVLNLVLSIVDILEADLIENMKLSSHKLSEIKETQKRKS